MVAINQVINLDNGGRAMKSFKSIFVLLTGMLFIVASSCASAPPKVTKLADNQYEIFVKAGLGDSREEIVNKWTAAAKETCNNYDVIDGPNRVDYNVYVAWVGKIRCK
jgi:hypothetical protein